MIGDAKLLNALSGIVKRTKADGISACAHAKTRRVIRFADSAIHQDMLQESISITLKVICGRQVGVAGTDALEPKSLQRCTEAALEIARHAPKQEVAPLPTAFSMRTKKDYIAATAEVSASDLVAQLKHLTRICQGAGVSLAGSLAVGEDEFAVANSTGVSCYAASTASGAKLVTLYRQLSGFASQTHPDVQQLNLEGILKESLRQSLSEVLPISLPIGTYEVILEPEAVAELVNWLGYIGFGAKSVEERLSFLAGRMGEQLMDPRITLYDDGMDAETLRMPFDFEGSPKQRVLLIDKGKAAGIVYDSLYALRFGQRSTGHGLAPDNTEGPVPLHLGMEGGLNTVESMIRSCKRGLWIPRFHYVNGLLNPREALMTGLTREGVWLIEEGHPTKPVATLRFTQNILEAFSHVLGLSKKRRLIADFAQELGCVTAPALHLKRFHFTGGSEA